MIIRIKWLKDGEKVGRYFCNLENRIYTCKIMCSIERNNGDTVFSRKEIEGARKLYGSLYSERETNDVDLKTIAPNVPSLSQEDRAIIEGHITYTEAHAAVRAMEKKKSQKSRV